VVGRARKDKMALFDTLSDINLFLILTGLFFGDWYAPTVSMWSDYQLFKKYYRAARKYMWLPTPLFFPIFVVILYVLMETAFYSFFKNAFHNEQIPAWLIPAIAFLFVFNLVCTKQWIAVYMVGRRIYLAFALVLGMIGTGLAIVILFGVYQLWLEFGTYLPFMLWCFGALYMTGRTWYVEKPELSTREES
jgi:tryptophan-rich sensory protein